MTTETHGTVAIGCFIVGIILAAIGASGHLWSLGIMGGGLLTYALISTFFVFRGARRDTRGSPDDDDDPGLQPGPEG